MEATRDLTEGGRTVDNKQINKFVKELHLYPLTSQQRKMLRSLALTGDLDGAKKGLNKCIFRNRIELNRMVTHNG